MGLLDGLGGRLRPPNSWSRSPENDSVMRPLEVSTTWITTERLILHAVVFIMSPKPFRFATSKEQDPIGTTWARQILSDSILLEATLFGAAVHMDRLHKRDPGLITLRHKGVTMRLVNEMLQSKGLANCDSLI